MPPSIGEPVPNGPESLLVSVLFLVLVAMGLWFLGSVLLRWAYSLRQVPKQFRRGRTEGRDAPNEERDR